MIADVAVVGGGPAGAAAAITLARSGRDVVLFDKAPFPRDKCCGDGLTAAALRAYEALGLQPETIPSWQPVDDVWIRSPSGRTVPLTLPRGRGTYAAIARRSELDACFLDVARAAGVKVHDGHALAALHSTHDSITLEVEGIGSVTARYAIGADGMWSTVRKLCEGERVEARDRADRPYLGEWHAFRQYFADVGPLARDQLWVWFEPDLLPGYAWSFPLPDGRANVGYGIKRAQGSPTKLMKDQWPDLLARPHILEVLGEQARPEAAHKAWPIPARVSSTATTAASGRALFVGDAARAADPLTGEGIAQALETGVLAANAIAAAGAMQPAHAATLYARDVKRTFATDHAFARLLSRALAPVAGARLSIRIAGSSAWTRSNFARWLFEDYPRAAIVMPRRWKRGMFSGPGAFS